MLNSKKKHVLIVDDSIELVSILRVLLESEGYAVFTASNGRVALLQLANQQIDLVILDLIMPEMNGWSVLDAIFRDQEWRNIPIMVASAAQVDQLPKGIPFLSKPFSNDLFLQTVAAMIEN